MTKFLFVLALSVFTSQGSVLRSYDTLKRVARSPCDYCGHDHHGPPPPQPDFHAQQWTGFLKTADGSQQGVFSGAAASAQYDTQSIGQAYSLSGAESNSAIQPVHNAGLASAGAKSQPATLLQGYQTKTGGNAAGSGQSGFGSQANAGESGLETHGDAGAHSVRHGFAYGSQGNGGANNLVSGQSNFGRQAYTGAHAAESGSFSSSGSSGGAGVQTLENGFAYGSQGNERANDFGPGHTGFGGQANTGAHAGESRPSGSSGSYGGAGIQSIRNEFAYGRKGNERVNAFGQSGFESQSNAGARVDESGLSSGSESRGDIGVPSIGKGFAYGSHGNEGANTFGSGQSGFGSQTYTKANAVESGPSSSFGSHRETGINSVGNGFAYGSQRNGRENTFGSSQSDFGSQANAGPNSASGQYGYGSQPNAVVQSGHGSQEHGGANAAAVEQSGGYGSSFGVGQSHQSAQSALDGALGLARQGLQAEQAAGCSTCGKTNYAFSNAKTHTGNAIALSVNG